MAKRNLQPDLFFTSKNKSQTSFGGSDLTSNPKTARPISTKDLMHVVLKSEKACGPHSFLKIERKIISMAQKLSQKINIQVKDIVVMGNHIHLSLKAGSRRAFQNYLRALSGLIARKTLGAEKFNASAICDFFVGRPFSRIVAQGYKSFQGLRNYFELNRLEKKGFSKNESRELGLVGKSSTA